MRAHHLAFARELVRTRLAHLLHAVGLGFGEPLARIKNAEAQAHARRIEANGEAAARQRLAEAEAYRVQKVGEASSDQLAREGKVVSAHPLLIQKTLAEKLSDRIQVLIVPPHAAGESFGANLLGAQHK